MRTATAKQFNEEPSRILGEAEAGETVVIEKHGTPAAALVPMPLKTSGAELARRLARSAPQPETAATVEALIKGMDEAG